MRHRKRSRRLVGSWEHRKALMRNLLTSLFLHNRITTTVAKAKELKKAADKMITLAKRGDLHARRRAVAVLQNKDLVRKIFAEVQERFGSRQGGYTRIVRVGPRRGDAAMMAIVELVEEKLDYPKSKKKKAPQRPKKKEVKTEASSKAEAEVSASEEQASEQPAELKEEKETSSEKKEETA